jgi:hypothetical protein
LLGLIFAAVRAVTAAESRPCPQVSGSRWCLGAGMGPGGARRWPGSRRRGVSVRWGLHSPPLSLRLPTPVYRVDGKGSDLPFFFPCAVSFSRDSARRVTVYRTNQLSSVLSTETAGWWIWSGKTSLSSFLMLMWDEMARGDAIDRMCGF